MTSLLERLALWWTSTGTPTKVAVLSAAAAALVLATVWLT